jgi:cation transport protein ChaC
LNSEADHCRHIFAYGSLMWRPDFAFQNSYPARIIGYHRSLCVISHHYRGTPEKPGLVLGLDRGGSCVGVVYEVSHDDWNEVIAHIRQRELITHVYREVIKSVSLLEDQKLVKAITYIVQRDHPQFFAPQSDEQTIAKVKQGIGLAGSCVDYVRNTVVHLKGLGIKDQKLEALAARL